MIGVGTNIMRPTTRVGFPALLRAHYNRVAADGGEVVDFNSTIALYRELQAIYTPVYCTALAHKLRVETDSGQVVDLDSTITLLTEICK